MCQVVGYYVTHSTAATRRNESETDTARPWGQCIFPCVQPLVFNVVAPSGTVNTGMGNRLQADKLPWCVTSHPSQLGLVIPPWVGAMNTNESWTR